MHGMILLHWLVMSGFAGLRQSKNLKQEEIILNERVLILAKVNAGPAVGLDVRIAKYQ